MKRQKPEMSVDFAAIALAGDDAVIPFAIEELDTRGRAVQLGSALDQIISRHDYPEPVARLLGEMIVLTVLLGTSLKFDGQLIVQTQTDGPVHLLVVDFRTPDAIRAYARFDHEKLDAAIASKASKPEDLLGKGVLAMTIDQGVHMQRYQGMVALEGDSLEAVAHSYFMQSEQIPTRVRLGVSQLLQTETEGSAKNSWRAGGALIQFLPESEDRIKHRDLPGGDGDDTRHNFKEDDAWVEAQTLFATIRDDELTDPAIGSEKLLFRLFHEQGLRLFKAQKIEDRCSCTSQKVWSVLRNMSTNELSDMTVDGKIEVVCEFCSADYSISPEDLKNTV